MVKHLFEDLTVMAARTLVQLFWLIILFILIFGTIWAKSSHSNHAN
jgi:capsule polysaccharide export protein KpsE/RkpR